MKKVLIILLIAIFWSANSSAQNTAEDDSLDFYLSKGYEAYDSLRLDTAFLYLEKTERLWRDIFEVEKDTDFVNYVLVYLEDIQIQKSNYQKALEYRKEITNIYKNSYGDNSENLKWSEISLNFFCGINALNADSLDSAQLYFEQSEKLWRELSEIEKDTNFVDGVLTPLVSIYVQKYNYQKAIKYQQEITNIYENVYGKENEKYYESLSSLAYYHDQNGNYKEAIELETQTMNIRKEVLGEKHPDYAMSLNDLAGYYDDLGNYNEAINYSTQALNIQKEILGEKHPDYATSLSELSTYFDNLGNYNEAIKLGTQALNIRKEILGEKHPDYATSLSELSTYFDNLGNYNEAIKLGIQAMNIRKEVLGEKHPDYAISLSNLALYYTNLGNYNEAIKLETQALNIFEKVYGEKHIDFAISLNHLAMNYSGLGNYNEAIKLGTQALNIFEKVYGEKHPSYATALGNLASYYADLGNYSEAIKLDKQTLYIKKEFLGENHPDYAISLCQLAGYYANLGNYSEAIKYCTQALNIRKEVLGEKHPDYATSLSNLASYYFHIGKCTEAIRLSTQALNIRKEVLGEKHLVYANSLNNLSLYYFDSGDYNKAIELVTHAIKIRKEILGEKHPIYATTISNLALYYNYVGNYNEAFKLITQALNIRKEVLGEKHPDYADALHNVISYYVHSQNYNEVISLEKKYLNLIQDIVLNTFGDLSNSERQMFWEKYNYEFNSFFPTVSSLANNSEATSLLYDKSVLFAKGLLLNSETEMTKLILENGDVEALKKYEELRNNRLLLNKLYEQPIAERTMNTDSLENVVNTQEKELVENCKVYGDYTKNLRLTWKDVQQHLGEQDLAVEFLLFPIGLNDSSTYEYIALTLCKNDTAPQMVTLFNQEQITSLCDTIDIERQHLKELIWDKMYEQLKGIKNIYFSPAGLLYNIGIEYLPDMEDYNFYRLSSTRELVNYVKADKPIKAVVYGNINYNGEIVAHQQNFRDSQEKILTYKSARSERDFRLSIKNLPNSAKEVDDVAKTLESSNVRCVTLMNDSATEESFKALSGKHVNLLHISTHGFYYSESEAENLKEEMRFLQMNNKGRNDNIEYKSLLHNALCFAGANTSLDTSNSIPEGVDDGILTAQEIAQVDLRGLDLVVLSACQTACGDINQGEGVFGLQRGFKKAGAQSLMMSLWPVDDEVTQILMSEFYKQYTAGKTKRAAFQAAQKHLRTVQNGKYNYPKYWAAFILLDAID